MSFPLPFFFLFIFVLLLKYAYPTSQGHQHLQGIWGHPNAAIKVSVRICQQQLIQNTNGKVWPSVHVSERMSYSFISAILRR